MATIKDILIKAGIAEDVQTKILDEMKANKVYTASEENLDVRYGKLKGDHDTKLSELQKANELIADLQKSTKGNDDLQGKIQTYEKTMSDLKAENEKIKLESALKVGLLSEKAVDIDYLTFKLKEKDVQLDEKGNIKGWDELITGIKTQFPTQFESASSEKKVEENKLPSGDTNEKTAPATLADAIKQTYETK